MKTFVGLFLSSAAFGATASIVYWFASRDYAGTLMLGFMFCGLGFAGGYALFTARRSNLEGDDGMLQHKQAAGEDVGVFTKESAWPAALAFSILWFLVGLIWSDFMLFTGIAAMLLCLWRLGAESARVGHERVMTEEGPNKVE